MSNAQILGALQASSTRLPCFDAHIPAGFPSPALDHMEHKLSLDALLDLQTPHTYVVSVSGDSMAGASTVKYSLIELSMVNTLRL